jgi:hypothetical protein
MPLRNGVRQFNAARHPAHGRLGKLGECLAHSHGRTPIPVRNPLQYIFANPNSNPCTNQTPPSPRRRPSTTPISKPAVILLNRLPAIR